MQRVQYGGNLVEPFFVGVFLMFVLTRTDAIQQLVHSDFIGRPFDVNDQLEEFPNVIFQGGSTQASYRLLDTAFDFEKWSPDFHRIREDIFKKSDFVPNFSYPP